MSPENNKINHAHTSAQPVLARHVLRFSDEATRRVGGDCGCTGPELHKSHNRFKTEDLLPSILWEKEVNFPISQTCISSK